jgi:hypothetical protein
MKIDDRALCVRNVMTYVLTHATEEGFDKDQFAARRHGAPTGLQDSYAVLVIPVMQDEAKKIEVACGDRLKEISGNSCAPLRKAKGGCDSQRLRHIFRPIEDNAAQMGISSSCRAATLSRLRHQRR